MKHIKKLLFPFVALALSTHGIVTLSSFSFQAPTFATGSPGDGNSCSNCHNNSGVTQISNVISTNIPESGYLPGETYAITISGLEEEKIKNYGFSLTVEDEFNNKQGVFIEGERTTSTQEHISHLQATPGQTPIWSFDWTAPEAGTGEVTFYGAFVLAKDTTGFTNQFKVKTSNISFSENVSTSLRHISKNDFEVFIANDLLHINNNSDLQIKEVFILNQAGQLVLKTTLINEVNVAQLKSGIYFTNLVTEKGMLSKKVFK